MTKPAHSLPAFSNEPVTDFSRPANRDAIFLLIQEIGTRLRKR